MKQLTIRGLLVGIAGLLLITASSMYVALRMGALPWPTVFVTVLSLSTVGRMKGSTLQEVNVTHTLMSSGAMVAGGLAFTIPGIWMLNPQTSIPVFSLIAMAVCGAILGTLFSSIFRKKMVEDPTLVYPIGNAAYQTLVNAKKGGKDAVKLFSSMGFSVLFTVIRDAFGWIPSILGIYGGSALVPPVSLWVSPMAMGIGAIIGPVLALLWLGGAIFGYLILTPAGIASSIFPDMAAASLFRENLGIGLMVGTGLGVFIKVIIDKISHRGRVFKADKKTTILALIIVLISSVILSVFTALSFFESLFAIVGVFLATYLSSTLTGQTGINPMEIFAIIVLLGVQVVFHPTLLALFATATVTAVACGLSGDVMNDFKSGHLLGTDAKQQVLAEGIGGVVGAVVAVAVLLVMKNAFGEFGSVALPAPQAKAVASLAGGLGNSGAFIAGVIIGAILNLLKVPTATLGLGIYLPIYISTIMGLGAIVSLLSKKFARLDDKDIGLYSSGLLGGEGITGVAIAIISMLR